LYDEFIYLLRELYDRYPWEIDQDRCIRTLELEGQLFCPITAACAAVTGVFVDAGRYRAAARLLGLDSGSADAVAQAADLIGSYNAHVRADLSHALRLGEQWGQEGRWNDPAFHAHPYPHGYDRPMESGAISPMYARPVGRRVSLPCTTRRAIAPSPSLRPAIINETARVRSILSALSATTPAKPSPLRPSIDPSGFASSSATKPDD